jgi:hypothetical protein
MPNPGAPMMEFEAKVLEEPNDAAQTVLVLLRSGEGGSAQQHRLLKTEEMLGKWRGRRVDGVWFPIRVTQSYAAQNNLMSDVGSGSVRSTPRDTPRLCRVSLWTTKLSAGGDIKTDDAELLLGFELRDDGSNAAEIDHWGRLRSGEYVMLTTGDDDQDNFRVVCVANLMYHEDAEDGAPAKLVYERRVYIYRVLAITLQVS